MEIINKMKYYLISTDNLDQIQFIPHPKRDVNVKGKIVELTEEEIKNMLLGLRGGDGEYWNDTGEIEKVRKVLK